MLRSLLSLALALALPCAGLNAQTQIVHTFNGDSLQDRFAKSVSGAGDVNADGYDDLIAGSWLNDANGFDSGSAMVYSGQTGAVLHTWHGDSYNDRFGNSVSGAGDVDGDGYHDVIVGAIYDDNNGGDSGSAKVFSGKTGAVLYTFNGDSAGDLFGGSVSGAGDVNADGFDDLIVGASLDDSGTKLNVGSATVFSGRTGLVLYTFYGDSADDYLGDSVCGAGDVNGDGFDDLFAGAPGDDDNGDGAGSARLYSGRTGAVLHTFHGDSKLDQFGWAVAGGGDANGDGYDDLIVGAFGDDNGGDLSGSARVFSGFNYATMRTFNGWNAGDGLGYSVAFAGDVDADGDDDILIGADLDDNLGADSGSATLWAGGNFVPLRQINGNSAGDRFGNSVAAAGDVNDDGFPDLFVGAWLDDPAGIDSGSATVFSLGYTGTPARMRIFGQACLGSNGHLPHIDYRGRMAIGDTIRLQLRAALPTTTVALILANPDDLDLGLVWPSLAGCRLYATLDGFIVYQGSDALGMSELSVSIPNNPIFVGWRLNAQWGCLDSAANAFGVVGSNALGLTIGS